MAGDWDALLKRFNGLCAYCGKNKADHRDHVTPISKGGTDAIGNILPACAPCNLSKGSLLLIEWKNKAKNDRRQEA
jgi:5-methylcytosine-specific restriction endonuclease McrA